MAIGIGSLGNIVEDFTQSLNQIFGANNTSANNKGGPVAQLFNPEYGGAFDLKTDKWTGNARISNGTNTKVVRYGFAIMNGESIKKAEKNQDPEVFYLDIAPQSIMQKELFASNITATRRGVIVETEGVVFKDIPIQGTTGIFPGIRGSANNQVPNFDDFSAAPRSPQGVDPQTGKSRNTTTNTFSGYEEFMRLRQFFLKYSSDKVRTGGDRFLVFINEKDSQELIVEPLEFTMERSSKSPMTYNYKIQLKAIGTLGGLFLSPLEGDEDPNSLVSFLETAGNVAANVSATIAVGRTVINQSVRLLRRFSQALDQTFITPLRQTQYAMEDLSDGLTTVLSLPEILSRNASEAVLDIRDSANEISTTVGGGGLTASNDSSQRAEDSAEFSAQSLTAEQINNDNRVVVQKSFVTELKDTTQRLSDDLADFTNLGSEDYDRIKGRVPTQQASSTKIVSDNEYLLMGTLQEIVTSLNTSRASNVLFESDAEVAFKRAEEQFRIDGLKEDQQIQINKPSFVREIIIQRNDTLERIAQREYNDALRWLDLVVLNNLKPPYISEDGGDGVKKPGERILIGSE